MKINPSPHSSIIANESMQNGHRLRRSISRDSFATFTTAAETPPEAKLMAISSYEASQPSHGVKSTASNLIFRQKLFAFNIFNKITKVWFKTIRLLLLICLIAAASAKMVGGNATVPS